MKLYCKKCNHILTNNLLEESEIKNLKYDDQEELLLLNKYIEVSKTDFWFNIPIKYLIHSKSIQLKNHTNKSRLHGCCGPSNFGNLNQVCPTCNFDIGTLISDCCFPIFVGVDENKVSLKPLW